MTDRIDRLRAAAQARHDQTLLRAETALARMTKRGQAITFRSVAQEAGVSRSWLYRQPELNQQINHLRETPATRPATRSAAQRASTDSLRQQIHTYREEITRLRNENQILRDELARRLGAARAESPTARF